MSLTFLAILVLNFAYIILLPRVFFRADGTFNLMWWITGFPLGLAPTAVVLHKEGLLPSLIAMQLNQYSEVIAALIVIFSFCLISFTLGTHRIPIALWHQNNDAPKQIVTWGAYKKIRHPFYTSFLLALVAALVAAPNILTLFSLVYGFFILNMTANKEETKLSTSAFGGEYVEYIKTTGRFVPKI